MKYKWYSTNDTMQSRRNTQSLKDSGLLPARQSGHATAIIVFAHLVIQEYPDCH